MDSDEQRQQSDAILIKDRELTVGQYRELESLFSHPGWPIFRSIMQDMREVAVELTMENPACPDIQFRQGQGSIATLKTLIGGHADGLPDRVREINSLRESDSKL